MTSKNVWPITRVDHSNADDKFMQRICVCCRRRRKYINTLKSLKNYYRPFNTITMSFNVQSILAQNLFCFCCVAVCAPLLFHIKSKQNFSAINHKFQYDFGMLLVIKYLWQALRRGFWSDISFWYYDRDLIKCLTARSIKDFFLFFVNKRGEKARHCSGMRKIDILGI